MLHGLHSESCWSLFFRSLPVPKSQAIKKTKYIRGSRFPGLSRSEELFGSYLAATHIMNLVNWIRGLCSRKQNQEWKNRVYLSDGKEMGNSHKEEKGKLWIVCLCRWMSSDGSPFWLVILDGAGLFKLEWGSSGWILTVHKKPFLLSVSV